MILCLTTPQNTGYSGEPLQNQIEITPSKLSIGYPYPNPFNHNVHIPLDVSDNENVSYDIFDINGHCVIKKENHYIGKSGNRKITWDGRNQNGQFVSAGTYFIRLEADGFSKSRKILFLK